MSGSPSILRQRDKSGLKMKNIHEFSGRMGNEMFRDAYIYAEMRRGKIPDVYLQDYRYFDEFRGELMERYGQDIGFIDKVGIHVRRAANPTNKDEPKYAENPFYVNLGETDYYERAMAMFPDREFLLFSDDIAYCQNRFKGDKITIVEGGTELSDFNQLASCEHQIIANSSFSYWAAYLNKNPNKVVIAPKDWYSDKIQRTICPPEWIKL